MARKTYPSDGSKKRRQLGLPPHWRSSNMYRYAATSVVELAAQGKIQPQDGFLRLAAIKMAHDLFLSEVEQNIDEHGAFEAEDADAPPEFDDITEEDRAAAYDAVPEEGRSGDAQEPEKFRLVIAHPQRKKTGTG